MGGRLISRALVITLVTGPGENLFLVLMDTLISAFIHSEALLFADDAKRFIHCFFDQIHDAIANERLYHSTSCLGERTWLKTRPEKNTCNDY